MRLIDADALRESWVCQPGHDFEPSAFVYSIDLQPTIAAPRWVRCEEPPKDEGRYFIAVKYKGKWLYNVAWYVKDIGDILGIPGDGTGCFVNNSTEVYPDYWMMPEPPKEGE